LTRATGQESADRKNSPKEVIEEKHMHNNTSACVFCAAVLAAIIMASPAAAYVNVFGGPTYTSGVGGFKNGHATGVNDTGIAIGTAYKYDAADTELGERAFRWDGSGSAATELGNLGTNLDGVAHIGASAINDAGTIIGAAERYDSGGEFLGVRAVRWDSWTTVATELGNLGTDNDDVTHSYANAINNAGTVVGDADLFDGAGEYLGVRAVRWDGSGTVATELGSLSTVIDEATYDHAAVINDAGTIVGNADKFDSEGAYIGSRVVRWVATSTAAIELEKLGTELDPVTSSGASAINSTGTIVGVDIKPDGSGGHFGYRAVRWDASSRAVTELENLGTDVNGITSSGAYDINEAGTTVGYADIFDGAGESLGVRAVRWEASGTAAYELGNLGTDPDGVTENYAYDINDAGIAVGFANDFDGSGTFLGDKAVYWGIDGVAMDLNALIDPLSGWTLEYADAISDTGWIAGSGTFDPDGPGGQEAYVRMFLMLVPALSVLPGDYNRDGEVDAADYVAWRKSPSNFGGSDGHNAWRANFGRTADNGAVMSAATNSAVPEPRCLAVVISAVPAFLRRRKYPRT
jgi:hypothetical protein